MLIGNFTSAFLAINSRVFVSSSSGPNVLNQAMDYSSRDTDHSKYRQCTNYIVVPGKSCFISVVLRGGQFSSAAVTLGKGL